jgi:zinc transporter ZupT
VALHSIFDGLSLGAVSSRSEFYSLLIAVVSHKALDGFSLGLSSQSFEQ